MQYCLVCVRHRGIEYELYNSYYLDFAPIRLCTLEEIRLKGYQHHTQVTVQNINHPDDLKYVILVHLWLFLFWFLQRRLTPQLLLSYRGSRLLLCWKRTCHSNHLSHHHWSKMKHLPAPPSLVSMCCITSVISPLEALEADAGRRMLRENWDVSTQAPAACVMDWNQCGLTLLTGEGNATFKSRWISFV